MEISLQLLINSLGFYKNNFLKIASIIFPFFLIVMGFAAILILLPNMVGISVFMIAILTMITWKNLAILYFIKNIENNPRFTDCYTKTYHRIPEFMLISALGYLVIIGGFVFLIAPALIIAVYISLYSYTYFFENLKGFDALEKSVRYVKGRWSKVLIKISFISILCIFGSFLTEYFIDKILPARISPAINYLFIELFFNPLSVIFLYLLYQNLTNIVDIQNVESVIKRRKIKLKIIFCIGLAALSFLIFSLYKNYPEIIKDIQRPRDEKLMIKLKQDHPYATQIKVYDKKETP